MMAKILPLVILFVALQSMPSVFSFSPPTDPPKPPSPDWLDAELTVLNFPSSPSPTLSAEHVAISCLRSLQLVDHPLPLAGLDRIYPFLTWQCRDAVVSSRTATPIEFRKRAALSPVLQPFMGATKIQLGKRTMSPGTATRGDIVSYPVVVHGAKVSAFQHKSGLIRDRVAAGPPRVDMVIRLEKARRPPLAGCWLVRDIVDIRFAKGGQGWSRHEGV